MSALDSVVKIAQQGAAGTDPWPVAPSLPPDAATETTLAQMASDLAASIASLQAAIEATQQVAGTVAVSNFPASVEVANDAGNPLPISAAALPLPSGAATESTLAGIKTGTDKIPASPAQDRTTAAAPASVELSDGTSFYKAATETTLGTLSAKFPTLTNTGSGNLKMSLAEVTGLSLGAGAADATTLRVVTATDGPTATATATTATNTTAISSATGTTADSAYAGSGNTTLIGALKGIYAKLAASIAVTGTVTANAGTGTLATSVADGANATIGTTTDAATATTVIGRLQKLISLLPVALTSGGSLKVAPNEGLYSADVTLQNAATATGNGTTMDVSKLGAVGVQVSGTFVATISFEVSLDGVTYFSLTGAPLTTTSLTATASAISILRFNVAGYNWFRARISSYISGSVTVVAHGITDSPPVVTASALYSSSGTAAQISGTFGGQDTTATSTATLLAASEGLYYNPTAGVWERARNNTEGTAIASGTYTSVQTSADLVNYNGRGVVVMLSVTAASGTGGLSVLIQSKNPTSGGYKTLNAAPSTITATGEQLYIIYPGASSAGSTAQSTANIVPRTFRVQVTHGDSSSYTYSVGYSIIV